MEKQSKIIFLSALVISIFFHLIILRINPEVEYENKTRNKEDVLNIINAVIIKKPVMKVSDSKNVAVIKTEIPKKRIKDTSVSVEKDKNIKKANTPIQKGRPKALIENKLKKLEENSQKLITPSGKREQSGIPSSNKKKKKVFIPFYKVDKKPQFLYRAELQYPLRAKELGVEGTVILEADIDGKGILVNVRVIKRAGFGFDEAAVDMIEKSKFTPAYANGKPVPVRMRFTIVFKLK